LAAVARSKKDRGELDYLTVEVKIDMQNTESSMVTTSFSRTNPFHAKVLKNVNLNGAGSSKETRHIELSLQDSDFSYLPGDCLGIFPKNDPELVDDIVHEMKWDTETVITIPKQEDTLSLREALLSYFDITVLTKRMLQQAALLTENEQLQQLVLDENKLLLREYMKQRDFLDLLRDFGPWNASAEQMVALLRKMPPRLYSIASSLTANPDEVHLTIGAVRYSAHGRERKGVCSVLCAERLQVGDKLPVFIQPNKHFKLPDCLDKDIIMVGPGTGIAPFRSFLQERAVNQGAGRSWLFFGNQHEASDYLYRDELENLHTDGVLSRLEVAFSRDTVQKVYVQHKMLANSKELYEWLKHGAHFYVCGDMEHMATDVHNTLIEIIEKEGTMARDAAEAYLNELQKQGRYQRDVY